jgi:succinoglycan biosynthesis protein ExoA
VLLSVVWPPMLTLPVIYALLCLVWGAILALNARDSCALASGPAAIIMHMAWSIGFLMASLRELCWGRSKLSKGHHTQLT